eukprot:TRINITY_DN2826_c0_g1_i2.p1 TRINITY_DN2826_c0_g1~~TRINITY_DN2826_c0_g1_i2.p1  ORF type:complete len:292 (-),score=144.08 TRINITY_DN2826_c0_g1_i2:53-928(-)
MANSPLVVSTPASSSRAARNSAAARALFTPDATGNGTDATRNSTTPCGKRTPDLRTSTETMPAAASGGCRTNTRASKRVRTAESANAAGSGVCADDASPVEPILLPEWREIATYEPPVSTRDWASTRRGLLRTKQRKKGGKPPLPTVALSILPPTDDEESDDDAAFARLHAPHEHRERLAIARYIATLPQAARKRRDPHGIYAAICPPRTAYAYQRIEREERMAREAASERQRWLDGAASSDVAVLLDSDSDDDVNDSTKSVATVAKSCAVQAIVQHTSSRAIKLPRRFVD